MHATKLPAQALQPPARALVVDDHPAVREGVRAMLDATPGLRCTGCAATAAEALERAQETRPNVVVLDHHLPDGDGVTLCLQLTTAHPDLAVVLYSAFADEHLAVLATIAGADALVNKSADPDELPAAALAAASGSAEPPSPSPAALEAAGSRLDPEDLPILGMLLHKTPPAEIARTLGSEESWLTTRRWAMLELLSGSPGRRTRQRTRRLAVRPRPPRPPVRHLV